MKEFIEKLIGRLEEKFKYNSEQAEIWRSGSDKDAYFREKKDLYLDRANTYGEVIRIVNQLAEEYDMGNVSDGYHTFNELYHHRAVLFAAICNSHKDLAWKSKLHDTGDMYDGMFIVGIETSEGQATYHYDINPYWDMFEVKELPKSPKWDGHTPNEAIRRIGLLAEEYKHCALCYLGSPCEYQNKNAILPNELLADKNGWIPCSERLPGEKENPITHDYMQYPVMVNIGGRADVRYYYYGNGHWRLGFQIMDEYVTHWMDIEPFQPKGE